MMRNNFKTATLAIMAAALVSVSGAALAADPIKGMIISKSGSSIVVRAGETDTTVKLTDATKIRSVTGALGVREETRTAADLVRGLPVEVKTDETAAEPTATEIKFKSGDLKTAQQISAGLVATDQQVAENADRIDNIGEMEAVDRTSVLFASGSSTISAAGKEQLQAIAAKAKTITGYRLAIVGRADTTGNAAANQRLSEKRAMAVKNYLLTSAGVLPIRILTPAAVGDSVIAQDPYPPKNDAEARRVTVTIVQSKSARK